MLRSTLAYATGLAATPFLDYAWHAWIAHGRRPDPSRADHLEHHRTADERGEPWAEIAKNAPRVSRTALGVGVALAPLVGPSASFPFAAGLATGYVLVTLSHARMHQRAPRTAWERWMWRFHFHHHYGDSKVNFGLTSPVFDFVFGTAVVPDEVAIPEGSLPVWWGDGDHPGLTVRAARRAPAAA